jgi:hypothetical protein
MTGTHATTAHAVAARAVAARARSRSLRPITFAVLVLLLIQYALGMWVNLFATIPQSDRGKGPFAAFAAAVAHGPAGLAVHALVGTLLLVGAIALAIRAALTRNATTIVLASIALLAIIAAWVNGALFVGNGANGSSFGMAMGAGLALLCYVTILFRAGRAATRAQ